MQITTLVKTDFFSSREDDKLGNEFEAFARGNDVEVLFSLGEVRLTGSANNVHFVTTALLGRIEQEALV